MSAIPSRYAGRSQAGSGVVLRIAFGLLTFQAAVLAHAKTVAAVSMPATVVVVSERGAAAVRYDFGAVSLAAGNSLQRAYTLKNSGTTPITIQRLMTSCGCTRAVIDSPGHGLTGRGPTVTGDPITLGPGQSTRLRLTINISELHVGPIRKTVTVLGSEAPLATIDLFATLVPGIVFSPQTIDFGPAAAGVAHSAAITATVDPRLLIGGTMPDLRSSDPSVHITPNPLPTVQRSSRTISISYRVILDPSAPLGPLSGRLYFTPPPVATPDDGQSLWNVAAAVTGQVVGDLSAAPSLLSLGTVAADTGATGALQLMGSSAAALGDLQFESGLPGVTARIVPTLSALKEATLQVTLAPHLPHGLLKTQITIRTRTGQSLLIPVIAYVK